MCRLCDQGTEIGTEWVCVSLGYLKGRERKDRLCVFVLAM